MTRPENSKGVLWWFLYKYRNSFSSWSQPRKLPWVDCLAASMIPHS